MKKNKRWKIAGIKSGVVSVQDNKNTSTTKMPSNLRNIKAHIKTRLIVEAAAGGLVKIKNT